MRIAFTSKDGIYINQHFGWCETFYIYDVDGENYSLIEEKDSSLKKDDEVEKLLYKLEAIEDCDIIYTSQIGPKAANMVQAANIYPIRATSEDDKIEDAIQSIQKMINGNAPLWLKRILLKSK